MFDRFVVRITIGLVLLSAFIILVSVFGSYFYKPIIVEDERKAFQEYIEQQPYFNLLIDKSVYSEDISEASECYIGYSGGDILCKEIHLYIPRQHMTAVKEMLRNGEIKSDKQHIFAEETYWYMYEPKENLQDWLRESGVETDTESEEVSFSVLMHTKNWWERIW